MPTEKETVQEKEHKRVVKLSTALSVVSNVVLGAVKLIAGIIGNSVAMITDAVHSISDIVTDIVVFFALRLSAKRPDEDHPYGHGKIENVAAVVVGVILASVSVTFIFEGVQNLIQGVDESEVKIYALIVAGVSIVVKEALFWITRFFGQKIKSEALEANAWHHRSDALSSIVALLAIGASLLGFKYGDLIGSILIALILMRVAITIVLKNGNLLMDAAVKPEIMEKADACIRSVDGVCGCRKLRLRWVGNRIYGEVNILVSADLSVKEGHGIAHQVKSKILSDFEDIKDLTVHVDPSEEPCH